MRLKQNVAMLLILTLLLGFMSLGIIKNKPHLQELIEQEINVIPETFVGSIKSNKDIPQEVIDVITGYMDDYFLSIYTLELQDTTKYFKDTIDGQVSDAAIKLTVESRKLYDFDFTMRDAHYDLNITQCINIDGKYLVDFLEDDYFCFNFLNEISSESYDIENSMIIEKVNDEYKISSYDKVQGYYMMFNDSKNDDEIAKIYDLYFNALKETIEDEKNKKDLVSSSPYIESKSYNVKYDRDAASEYASTYCHLRNDEYYDFSNEGGNCQNMASQALVAGGILMDDRGDYQWYYHNHLDYDSTWVHVKLFNDYCTNSKRTGLICDVDANICYAEPGDLIQVGINSVSHTTVVSKVIDGHILLNSNSIDMKDFPLEAYTYPVRKLIKILGSNT